MIKKTFDIKKQNETTFISYPVQEYVPLSHFPDGCQCVLYNAHDWSVSLGGDDHSGNQGQIGDLRLCLQGLRQVEIHLISIKISIVRGGYTKVRNIQIFLGGYSSKNNLRVVEHNLIFNPLIIKKDSKTNCHQMCLVHLPKKMKCIPPLWDN